MKLVYLYVFMAAATAINLFCAVSRMIMDSEEAAEKRNEKSDKGDDVNGSTRNFTNLYKLIGRAIFAALIFGVFWFCAFWNVGQAVLEVLGK